MSIEDRILSALQRLRLRRCRPDLERILAVLHKESFVKDDVVVSALEGLTDSHSIIRVEYKGAVSYRDCSAWARAHSVNMSEQLFYCSAVMLNSVGVSAAVCAVVAALSGENSFATADSLYEYFGTHRHLIASNAPLSVILQREVNAGNLVKVGSLGFMRKERPDKRIEATSSVAINKEKRIKKAKKIFDPSDVHDVSPDDSAVLAATPERCPVKTAASPAAAASSIEAALKRKPCKLCYCDSGGGVLLECIVCSTPFHLRCLGYSNQLSAVIQRSPWVCMDCRSCVVCCRTGGELIFCDFCDEAYHLRCHQPPVRRRPVGEWVCTRCRGKPAGRGRPFKSAWLMAKRRRLEEKEDRHEEQQQRGAPSGDGEQQRGVSPGAEAAAGAVFRDVPLTEQQLVTCVPDVTDWTVDHVAGFIASCGFEECAGVFRLCAVDGAALKLLTKQDVIGRMGLKLGPAVKLYNYVRLLQRKPLQLC